MSRGEADPTEAQTAADGRIRELDGLRGVAVALVMAQHAFTRPHQWFLVEIFGVPIAKVLDIAWCGVDLFFVLSGFLIGGIILEHRDAQRFYPAFYARRTARIFPAHFLLIALAFIPLGKFGVHGHQGGVPLLAYVTFTSNFYTAAHVPFAMWLRPLWSVAIEEQFYLIAPASLRALSARIIPWLLVAVIAASAGLRSMMLLGGLDLGRLPWEWTPTRLDGLALGVLAAWLMRKPAVVRYGRSRARAIGPVFVLLLAGCAWFAQQGDPMLVGPGILWISITATVALLLVRLRPEGWFGQLMRLRHLVFLGRYSYFLYLFHMPALWVTAVNLRQDIPVPVVSRMAADALALCALCAIAPLSWRFFEAPLLALGRRVGYGPRRSEPAAAAQAA